MAVPKKRQGAKKHPKQSDHTIQNQPQTRKVNIKYKLSEDISAVFSDNLLVQHREGLFFLSFMRNQYPLIFSKADLLTVKDINSTAIVQLAITPVQFAKNIIAMEDNFKKFLKVVGSEAKDHREFLKELGNAINEDLISGMSGLENE